MKTVPFSCRQRALVFIGIFLLSFAARAEEVVIGWVGPIRRPHAISLQQGAQLAIDEANQRNIAINGQKLTFKLLSLDDNDNPNLAINAANSLIAARVVAVIGHYTTETTIAAAKIYAEAGIPEITVFGASPSVTQRGFNNVFQLIGNVSAATPYMAEAFSGKSDVKRVAVAYSGSLMGTAVAEAMEQELAQRGNPAVGRVSISPLTSDFNDILNMLDKSRPDILFFAGIQQQVFALAKRLKETGSRSHLLLTGGAFNTDFFSTSGGYDDGTMIMLHGKPEKQLPGFARFEKAYQDKFRSLPMPYAVNAYDAVNVVVRGIQSGNSTVPRVLTGTLHSMTFEGVTGKIAFDRTGRLLNPGYTLYRVEQKKWKPLRVFP